MLAAGNRLVGAGMGAFLGLALWSILSLFALRRSLRPAFLANPAADPLGKPPSFWWWGATAVDPFVLCCFLVGPERMMDGFERVLGWLGRFAEDANRHG